MKDCKLSEIEVPKKIIFGKCWARDGLQNEGNIIATEHKIEMINRMQEIGIKKLEVTSFAHPKILPQFKDAEEVLKKIKRLPGVEFRAICTNLNAVERAVRVKEEGYGVDELAMVISVSEAHNLANVKMTHKENMLLLEKMIRLALDTGHKILGWALTSFGCAIMGDIPIQKTVEMGQWWKDLGAHYIGFGDTTGVCNPKYAAYFYEYIKDKGFTKDEVIVHFHDTRGTGVANNVAALQAGMIYFDGSLGAIGGQPATGANLYHLGYAGNTCSEDLVLMFEEMGVDTGIDVHALCDLGKRAEEIVGRQLRSNVIRCGPVNHGPVEYQP